MSTSLGEPASPTTTRRPLTTPAWLLSPWTGIIATSALSLLYGVFFGWLSLERYWTYQMHALDMGNMAQAAWNTVHGHPFYFTTMRLPYAIEAWNTTSRLSFHVEALFPLISIVYLISSRPESLLILQTVALALGAIPTYLLARDVLHNLWLALVFPVAYLLYPTVEALNLYEFHPVALATPLLIAAFYFMQKRRWIPFGICALAATGTKEEIGLVVAMFGLYAAVVMKERRIGLITAGLGVAWSLFATLVVEHHFRHTPTVTYLRSRYGYVCAGPQSPCGLGTVFHTLTHDPGSVIRVLFVWPKVGFLLRLLAPLGFMGVLCPIALLLGLPTFALDLLSGDFHMYTALGDNAAELAAVVTIASILGTRVFIRLLSPWLSGRRAAGIAAVWVLGLAFWNQYSSGFTPIGSAYQSPSHTAHDSVRDRFVAMVPAGVPVSSQDQLEPHLAGRHDAYLFIDRGGNGVPPADYVLLDVSAPTYPLPSSQIYRFARSLIDTPRWGVAAAEDGLILIERGAGSRNIGAAFYRYAQASGVRPDVTLSGNFAGLDVLGYTRNSVDMPNHHTPNLAYTFFLRPIQPLSTDLQPVVYETMDGKLLSCVKGPLGLSWLPTSRWTPGRSYRVRMDTLETSSNLLGTATLYMELLPATVDDPKVTCDRLWHAHGRLWPVGSLDLTL